MKIHSKASLKISFIYLLSQNKIIMPTISNFLIAAPSSGTGKTTLTLGLLRALKNRGMNVQPFKCGPDYIDTKFHTMASGNNSINLDLFLSSKLHVENLYNKHIQKTDVAIIEGVMGLFDGYDKMKGSSAEIAETLNVPVILVVNAKSMAYSIAPLIYGFKNYYKNINLIGVIFNFVGSESHYNFLKDACSDIGVKSLGYFPKNSEIEIPSRHLGLSLDEKYRFEDFANKIASIVEQNINIDKLLEISKAKVNFTKDTSTATVTNNIRIAVAQDEAFNFVYLENIESLRELGTVSFFSPLQDKELPETDFVYLPGGYPELYAKQLSDNTEMINSIKQYAEAGGKILAECGGMMYLSSYIIDSDGKEYPMVDILKQVASMEEMRLKLGYRQFNYNNIEFKGHEFHYSDIKNEAASIATIYNAKKVKVNTKLLRYKNVIAGYTHIYWAEKKNILDLFN